MEQVTSVTETAVPERFIALRRAAVAFADIVGYTILMGADPVRTHARWMALLHGTLRPLARGLGSHIVKSTGDGIVADFPTVADALAWADAVHAVVQQTDRHDLPPVAFRIAIAAGDIHTTDDDIYGACVNIAARLQEHAPPGGIAMTAEAREALSAPPAMNDLGIVHLRNIAEQVQAYARPPAAAPRTPMRAPPGGLPSVAVMPFENLGGLAEHAYFASGIIEDIVLSLGALPDLAVTARSATLTWAGARQEPTAIGRVLGVRYVLTGTVRRGADHLRLTADLRETEQGDSLWSDRIEAKMTELFAVQDEIVARVVAGIAPSIRAAELRRALRATPNSLTAYDHTLRGMYVLDSLRRETFADAGTELGHAIKDDPGFAMPLGWSSRWHSFAYGQGWTTTPDRDAALWAEMAARAVALDPRNAMGHTMAGHHRAYVLHDPEGALQYFDRALSTCPNHAPSLTLKAGSLAYLGRGEEALPLAERGFQLSPHGPERHYYLCFVGVAHFARADYASALQWLRMALADNPQFNSCHRYSIACLVGLARMTEAQAMAAELLRVEPTFRVSDYARTRQPFVDQDLRDRMVGALRAAGLPD